MAHFPLIAAKIILDKYDLTGDSNSIRIERTAADLDNTCFGMTFKARISGLQDGVFGMSGILDLADDGIEEILNAKISLSNQPILVSLNTPADGSRCKFGVIQQGQYQGGGAVGELGKWSADGRISGHAMVDGWMTSAGAYTGTGNSAWNEAGAVSATQKLYATIHATAKSTFTSAVFKIQSADNAGGANATDRITFTTITDLTSQFATPVSGAITQTFWRLTCSAFTGTSLTVYSGFGIQ